MSLLSFTMEEVNYSPSEEFFVTEDIQQGINDEGKNEK